MLGLTIITLVGIGLAIIAVHETLRGDVLEKENDELKKRAELAEYKFNVLSDSIETLN